MTEGLQSPVEVRALQERELTRGFTVLLAVLVFVLAVVPFVPFDETGPYAVTRFRVLFSAILLAGVYAIKASQRTTAVGVALVVPAFVAAILSDITNHPVAVVANFVLSAAFLLFASGAILETILRQHRVTRSTIEGGIAVYLMIGVGFVLIYGLLEYLAPGSFLKNNRPFGVDMLAGTPGSPFPELIYFSFVTLTTVGYGDVHPATHHAQVFAVGEAIAGQLYITIFIARLVGLHIHHMSHPEV